jgi:hypothetical protein
MDFENNWIRLKTSIQLEIEFLQREICEMPYETENRGIMQSRHQNKINILEEIQRQMKSIEES